MLLLPSSQTVPSGALRATSTAAILPPAPGRFSITTCWPQDSASFWPRARARISLGPPGVKKTKKRTGFSGQPWAAAPPENAIGMNKAAAMRLMGSSSRTSYSPIAQHSYGHDEKGAENRRGQQNERQKNT